MTSPTPDPLDPSNPGPSGIITGRSPDAVFPAPGGGGRRGVRAIWRGWLPGHGEWAVWQDAPNEEAARAGLAAELDRLGLAAALEGEG